MRRTSAPRERVQIGGMLPPWRKELACRWSKCDSRTLRYSIILPVIMPIVIVGAFEGSHSWGDLFVLLAAGLVGWTMKHLKWARPPLILGAVLGVLIERYMSISTMRYGADWLTRPGVLTLLSVSAIVFLSPMFRLARSGGLAALRPSGKVAFKRPDLMYVFFIGIGLYMGRRENTLHDFALGGGLKYFFSPSFYCCRCRCRV